MGPTKLDVPAQTAGIGHKRDASLVAAVNDEVARALCNRHTQLMGKRNESYVEVRGGHGVSCAEPAIIGVRARNVRVGGGSNKVRGVVRSSTKYCFPNSRVEAVAI